jgi:hypothetical protein
LKQNNDKTEVVVFAPPRVKDSLTVSSVQIGDVDVDARPSAQNLGCVWDQAMDMEAHVSRVCTVCYFHLHNLSAIRGSLTREAAEKLVHAFVTSRLDSCNAILFNLPKSLISKLQRVQNTAARIVTRASRYASITAILHDLHWLPIQARIEFKICALTWKALHDRAPDYIKEMLTPYTASRSLRSNNQELLCVPKCRVKYGERAFSAAAPRLWNTLPITLRQTEHYDLFKCRLKTHLFNQSYNS